MNQREDAYRRSGVDLKTADETVGIYRDLARLAPADGVVGGIGHFAGLYAVPGNEGALLVAGADGVGTKLLLAREADRLDDVGIDAVAMVVNDLLAVGARPLFLLDYLATDHLDATAARRLVSGVAKGCAMAGCALLGGETAELPDLIARGTYDLAAFGVGIVDRQSVVSGEAIRPGDRVLALGSDGFHSNGFSLIRKILKDNRIGICDSHPDVGPWAPHLLQPTRIYVRPVLAALSPDVHGLCHVTGGGIPGNLARILPAGCGALLRKDGLRPDAATRALLKLGDLTVADVLLVWNLGVGFIVVAAAPAAEDLSRSLTEAGERAWDLGEITAGEGVTWR